MLVYKIDAELNQLEGIRSADNIIPKFEFDLGSSDQLTIYSNSNSSSLYIDKGLLCDGKPLIRIIKRYLDPGIEYSISPMILKLSGSIYLVDSNGITKYNLTLKTNEC